MKVAELLERRRASWDELEALCRDLELHRTRKLGVGGALRFASAYRSACADLALADAYQLPPHTVQYLHELVGRAHNQLYRSQRFRWATWTNEVFRKVPARILYDRSVWLAMVIFWGIFLAAMALGYASPEFSKEAVGAEALESVERMYAKPIRGRDATTSAFMGGFYVFNNAGIGLRCFAAGLILGVGGLFITVSNALQLGVIFGHMINADGSDNFFEFVTAHGPFELTAIVLASAAGMRLGFSLVSTGGMARWASLRKAVDEATPTMAVSVVLFCLAAAIEGFLSPSGAPYAIKAGVAIASTAILVFYVGVLGWRGADADAN